jgi:cellulose synthase/poly-beta-1,6-N-acetylglucosamine synthase-like glycosyltransferase
MLRSWRRAEKDCAPHRAPAKENNSQFNKGFDDLELLFGAFDGASTDGAEGPAPGRVRVTVLCIAFTLFACVMASVDIAAVFSERLSQGDWAGVASHALFTLIVACLIYGGLVYQLTRLIHLRRFAEHRPVPERELRRLRRSGLPSLAVLVPSYKEEPRVVAQTLLSAALQNYGSQRVVLLIDDPPSPGGELDAVNLKRMRALPKQLQTLLEREREHFEAEGAAFQRRISAGDFDARAEALRLASSLERASEWFARQATVFNRKDHAESLFRKKVLLSWRYSLLGQARRLSTDPRSPSAGEIARSYGDLAQIFSAEVTSFERKRYVNLSHEANKAMNLNSYIGLMGKRWRQVIGAGGRRLDPVESGPCDLQVPDADYVITLDADSVLVPDYALRLVEVAERPGNERLAVVQTPYSAFPGASLALERIAGATTDIQYNIHQGFTGWNATYWVGANAVIRKAALDDIAEVVEERGYPVKVYIQDRTVIEDTESTVDLIARGWRLFNYPERLAYSATPPDFGSLIIQRRRWANGGLIILPKLLRYLLRGEKSLAKLKEAFFRVHYLASIAAVNVGLLVILAVPFTDSIRNWWLPLTALPYFCLYGRDLKLAGYRASDLVRVYALNLVLIPVNLGGVIKSLQQGWTGSKIPFGRTPKVSNRTVAAPVYVLTLYLLVLHWFAGAGFDIAAGLWVHGAFAAANASLLLFGIAVFVGFRHSWEDLRRAEETEAGKAAEIPLPWRRDDVWSLPLAVLDERLRQTA